MNDIYKFKSGDIALVVKLRGGKRFVLTVIAEDGSVSTTQFPKRLLDNALNGLLDTFGHDYTVTGV